MAFVLTIFVGCAPLQPPVPAVSSPQGDARAPEAADHAAAPTSAGIHDELVDLAAALVSTLASEVPPSDSGRSTTIAILPFTSHERVTEVGEHLARDLTTVLVTRVRAAGLNHLDVVSREHLDELLAEQSLSLRDAFEQGPARLLGKLKAADLLVTGMLVPSAAATHLSAHVLRVSDGVVLGAHNAELHVPAAWRVATAGGTDATHAIGRPADPDTRAPVDGRESTAPSQALLEVHQANPYVLVGSGETAPAEIETIFWIGDTHGHAEGPLTLVHEGHAEPAPAEPRGDDGESDEPGHGDGDVSHKATPLLWKLTTMDHRAIDFCLVLDTSGSMKEHDRLEFAGRAARKTLMALDAEDRFSLITFNSAASVLVGMGYATDAAKAATSQVIETLTAKGKTNFEAALEEVSRLFRQHPTEAPRTRYVLFVSDGEPTVAMSDPDGLGALAHEIADQGISIHTLGVGHDLKIETLERIATHGKGRLHFVDDAAALESYLPELVGDVLSYLADDVRLTFLPAPGMQVVLEGTGWRRAFGGDLRADLGLIPRGDVEARILHLQVSGAPQPGARVVAGTATLSWTDPSGLRRTEQAVVAVEATDDAAFYRNQFDLAVVQESHLVDLRAALRAAYDLATSGESGSAALQLAEALEHVQLMLETHADQSDQLAALIHLVNRTKVYQRSLEHGELADDLRLELYRDAVSLSD